MRRRELIKVTLAVMSERGFADTRITDVAERAGISPALVIYYFSTKDELLTEALRSAEDSWYEIGAARTATMDNAAARLEQIVALTCLPQPNEDLPESWSLWLDLWTQSVRNPGIAAVRREDLSYRHGTIFVNTEKGGERRQQQGGGEQTSA